MPTIPRSRQLAELPRPQKFCTRAHETVLRVRARFCQWLFMILRVGLAASVWQSEGMRSGPAVVRPDDVLEQPGIGFASAASPGDCACLDKLVLPLPPLGA